MSEHIMEYVLSLRDNVSGKLSKIKIKNEEQLAVWAKVQTQVVAAGNTMQKCGMSKGSKSFLPFLVATDNNGVPERISVDDRVLIQSYCERVFDAGFHFEILSNDADSFKCELLVKYDPLVLNKSGQRLDGGNDTPVIEAINSYFRSFPFDSEYSNMALTEANFPVYVSGLGGGHGVEITSPEGFLYINLVHKVV